MRRVHIVVSIQQSQSLAWGLAGAFFCASLSLGAQPLPDRNQAPVQFNQDIRPILSDNCFQCHGPDEAARKARLRLDVREEALKPAKSDLVAIVPGAPEKSELIARITASDTDDLMPPVKSGKKLTPGQIDMLRRWIAEGAPYAKHWSYEKPSRPALPQLNHQQWPRNPVDHFILARLEREKLKTSPPADPHLLIRRVSLDLIGLPPSPEEVDQFANDRDPLAYEKLVDRLLNSEAFGEHWARLWLDLARYADSAGYADDPPRTIWAYRDYVIRALNANTPFDRFTLEQIAGDLLEDADEDALIATAFHRNTMTNNEGGTNDEEFRNAAVVDRVNTTMSVWMGTSMACAQCHTHKYDPITQQEYFQFLAFFNNTRDADLKDESPLLELFSPAQKRQRARLEAEIKEIEGKFRSPTPESLAQFSEWERSFPHDEQWLAAKPVAFKAREGGAISAAGDDALEIAPPQESERYTVQLSLAAARITGLRIEAAAGAPKPDSIKAGDSSFSLSRVAARILAPAGSQPVGRFVRVELPGKEKILSLAEVQVFNGDENLALSGEASQSSTDFNGPAKLAIDGNTDGDFDRKSVTHTALSENPWCEVDLKSSQPIERVVIWNRTDNGLQTRLNGARLLVLNEHREVLWQTTIPEAPKASASFVLDGSRPVEFKAAFADSSQPDFNPSGVIKEKGTEKGWAVELVEGRPRYLTLLPARALEVPPGSTLELTFEQRTRHDRVAPALLRFRVSEDARISEFAGVPASVLNILAMTPADRDERQRAALSEFYRANLEPALKADRERLAELKKQLAAIQPNTVPIMRELAADQRRKTHIQLRGNYLALGEEVTEAVPAAFHPLPRGAKPDRLALARWLVDEDNPLTARVTVNRLWEQIFGNGLVRTSEDFGIQGELPTHPELLDWLATEFMALKWDVKAFLKLLVTSVAYRQSSRITPELLERDPDNLLLARGPRSRMPAEVIRDQALAVSGLLSRKMLGPPVRPPQPSLGLTAAFGGSLDWKTSEGEDRYRRGLYIEWRRTNPYASMATFDAPNREVCALRRPRSNTPLQALVTLNDPVYVEAAQALGRRMAQHAGSTPDKVRFGFRLCLARPPRDHELGRLVEFHEAALAHYSKQPEAAKQMAGELPASYGDCNPAEFAAWAALGNVLLNLDEFLMRP